MVRKIESEPQADRLLNRDQTQEPTAYAPEFPESPGDRERGKFRPSKWRRLTQVAASNDDGSPIAERTEQLLEEVNDKLTELLAIKEPITRNDGVFIDTKAGKVFLVGGKTLHVGPIGIPGIVPAVLYSANDVVGTIHAVEVPKSGIIQSVRFYDKDDEGANMTLLLFREEPSADETDNAQPSLTDDDLSRLEAAILVDTWHDLVDNQIGTEDNLGIAYTAPEEKLWALWITRGSPTIAAANTPLWSMTILADE